MTVERTGLEGLLVLRSRIFADGRGHFMESFNDSAFHQATGLHVRFIQDNESLSHKGVVRGLHYQMPPHGQAKLVRVVRGRVLDVCVDIRPDSPTYGRHFRLHLSEGDATMLYIPIGFAHGFSALEQDTLFHYKCSAYYQPAAERTLLWNDTDLAIDWEVRDPVVSDKDRAGVPLMATSWTER
ncbi:MAG: dTDP-4-dehydrorhamnose 3,5-epimerase [Flavobacteriales bacterium]|nr:dTDP-4-dehydrorhamnose 3,5-epimerase [Flavobacteriales bacterium]